MTDDQIKKLDRCRDQLKSLYTKTGQIQEILKELTCYGNHDLGKELDDVFKVLRNSVNKNLMEASNEIHNLIKEI